MLRFLLLAALFVPSAQAAAQTLLSGFVSHHFRGEYCESNPGIGLRFNEGKLAGVAVGAYRNSLCRTSVYIAREWQYPLLASLSVGFSVGATTGYQWAVTPALLPEVVFHHSPVEVAVIIQPLNLRESPAFVALQFRWDFSPHSR